MDTKETTRDQRSAQQSRNGKRPAENSSDTRKETASPERRRQPPKKPAEQAKTPTGQNANASVGQAAKAASEQSDKVPARQTGTRNESSGISDPENRPARQRRPAQEAAGQKTRRSEAPRQAAAARTAKPANKTERRPAQSAKKTGSRDSQTRSRTGDSGYQPYRKANEKTQAQRTGTIKTFFSAQNPILKWFEKSGSKQDAFTESSDLARQRREQRAEEARKRKKRQSRFDVPAVVYTQPQAFNRDRLVVQLMTIVAVVLAFVLGLSVFFKVKVISISGAEVYSPWSIREASGIHEGDNLLTFGRARAASQIRANLPYVKSVRIGIKLPDTVNIEIVEDDIVYAIKSDDGIWWLINSEGKVMEMANSAKASNYTQVVGVTLTSPVEGQTGVATENAPAETTEEGEAIPVTVTGAQRLNVALQILAALEDNDIVGEAASVDVSRLEDIILWYGTRYQVNLGDSSNLDYKIACMCDAILQMSDYQTGILDISFTTWTTQVGYTPFE